MTNNQIATICKTCGIIIDISDEWTKSTNMLITVGESVLLDVCYDCIDYAFKMENINVKEMFK